MHLNANEPEEKIAPQRESRKKKMILFQRIKRL